MECPRCRSQNPDVAAFCFRCGESLARPGGRRNAYAVQSSENVTQFAVISTIMPHTNRDSADGYRWALLIAGVLVLVFTLIGWIPVAITAAAVAIPVTYLIYIYDVNLWEDQPVPVILGLFVFTAALSAIVSLIFFRWVFGDQFSTLLSSAGERGSIAGLSFGPLLLFAVLLPIIAEVVKNIGPVTLASRPQFDDMIDGLTFGVAAGTAYAAAESIVAFLPVFSGGLRVTQGVANWIPVVLNIMIVKTLIYGTATGIAAATFSGRGEGYDGFTPKYFQNFALAAGANIVYWLGVRLLAYAPFGQALGLIWGLVVLAFLVIRIRVLLHTALLEAAVEDASNDRRSKAATTEGGFCPECEMPLLSDALFCIVCGASVRATSGIARRSIREAGAPQASTGGVS